MMKGIAADDGVKIIMFAGQIFGVRFEELHRGEAKSMTLCFFDHPF